MNWAIAADNTAVVAQFFGLVVKLNSSHSAKKGLICDFEYIW